MDSLGPPRKGYRLKMEARHTPPRSDKPARDPSETAKKTEGFPPMPPARPASAASQPQKKRNAVDEELGRVQSYVLKDLFQQRATMDQQSFLKEQEQCVQL